MLYLKEANIEDAVKEYEAISRIPAFENGFGNVFYNMTKEEFIQKGLAKMISFSTEKMLRFDRVPETYFFLWDDDVIVGLFKIRHYLNDSLRDGAGHIGYGILRQYRGRHYATRGLALALEKCRELVREDEVYLACFKNNVASVRTMLNNGARIVRDDGEIYYTRIPLR